MGLILPSLYSELEGEALPAILEELKSTCRLPLGNRHRPGQARTNHNTGSALDLFQSSLPQRHRVLWNDGSRLLQALDQAVAGALDLAPKEAG